MAQLIPVLDIFFITYAKCKSTRGEPWNRDGDKRDEVEQEM